MASGVPFVDITDETDTCYVIARTESSNIIIKVFNVDSDVTYYFRVLARENIDGSTADFDETYTRSGNHAYTFTISGLSSSTDYLINVGEATNATGYGTDWWGPTECYTATTTAPTINTPTIDGKDVRLPWKNNTGKTVDYVVVSNDYIKEYGSVSSSTTTRYADLTFNNYDTTYTVYVYTIASNGRANFNNTSFTTDPEYEKVEIEVTDWEANGNIVTIEVEAIKGEVDYFKIKVGTEDKTSVTDVSYSKGYWYLKVPFNNFGTSYTVSITAYGLEGETSEDSVTVTTGILTKWHWNNYNYSTGWYEDDALSGKGPFSTITSDRWEAFIAFFNGLTEAAADVGVTTKAFTVGVDRTDILTASDFWGLATQSNSTFVNAGLSSYYTRPSENSIQKEKPIYGYYITDLTTAYNKLVDYIS